MDRVSASNFATVGGLRQFVDANLSTNTLGTGLNATWHNGVQESILAPVGAVGLVPTDADNTQLLQAISIMSGFASIQIAASGSLTLAEMGIVAINASSANVVLNLPAAATIPGKSAFGYLLCRYDTASANTVSVVCAGTDAIRGGGVADPATITIPVLTNVWLRPDGNGSWFIAHGLATAVTQPVGDNTTAVATDAFVQATTLGGPSQSWQNLVASRALGTTYTNSSGRPIMVNAFGYSSGTNSAMALTTGGSSVIGSASSAAEIGVGVCGIVQAGATYSVNVTAGTGTLQDWSELR